MTSRFRAFTTIAAAGSVMLLAAAAQAQAPQNAAGAQAAQEIPRALDGHPDFTGVWTTYSGGGGRGGFGRGGGAGGPAAAGGGRGGRGGPGGAAAAAGGRGGGVPAAGAFNRDGGGRSNLTPLAEEKVAAYRAVTQGTNHSPGAYCVGSGMPASMTGSGGYPMEILQHPRQINVTYEAHKEIRRIYIGDHGYDESKIFPERNGFSVAHWEGDTLVVETTHLEEQVDSSAPHSEQARIVERYTLGMENGRRVITNEWTMTDPLFLTAPMTGVKRWQELEGGRLLNYECTEPQWADILDRLLSGEKVEYQGE